jgi:anti-anti-sigma regulatory factor
MSEFGVDPVSIDVGRLVRKTVASLYSSLVTRPTGQAVRMAIENVLAEETGPVSLSVIDLSQVTIIDFSCADEVVAKLLLRFLDDDRPRDAFFVFRGIQEMHRDPIEVVLERQMLAAVSETDTGDFELIGSTSWKELEVWRALEGRGRVRPEDVSNLMAEENGAEQTLGRLAERRLIFQNPLSGEYQALSDLLGQLT